MGLPHSILENWAIFGTEGIGIEFTVPSSRVLCGVKLRVGKVGFWR